MTRIAYVHDLSYALGEQAADIQKAETDGLLVSEAKALESAGFARHFRAADDTSAYDLAVRAVEPMESELAQTDAIVYSTCIPANANLGNEERFRVTRDVKYLMDFPASRLQNHFGLRDAFVVGLNQQACTGMLGSLRLAHNLIRAEPEIRKVLCVTSDRFPHGALYEQSYNLISDGAAACLVSVEPTGFRYVGVHAVTNGAMVMATDDQTVGSFFNYTHDLIRACVDKAGIGINEIDWFVPQNTNVKAWQILARLLGMDFERVYLSTLSEVGHVISGDNIVNLKHLEQSGKLKPGHLVLLVMAGYGSNWQCVILEKTAS